MGAEQEEKPGTNANVPNGEGTAAGGKPAAVAGTDDGKEGKGKPAAGAKAGEEGKEGKPPAGAKAGEKEGKKKVAPADDDDDIPDDAELIELSPKALKARINRHTRRELQQHFGTDDVEKILKDLNELKELRADKEEARKAQLSKEQRLAEEKKEAEQRAKEAEERAQALEDERDVGQVSAKFTRLAADHIDPKVLEDEDLRPGFFKKLAKHLHAETNGKHDRITDKMVSDFWKNFAHDNPKYAKGTGQPPVEVKIQSGSNANAPPNGGQGAPSGQGASKTAKPGQANTMSRQEIAATYGLRW